MYFIPKKFRNFSPGRHNFSLRQTITIIMSLSLPFIVAACGSLPTPYEVEASRNRVMKFVNSRGEAISRLNQLLRRQPMTPDSETKLRNVCRGCYYKVKSVNIPDFFLGEHRWQFAAFVRNTVINCDLFISYVVVEKTQPAHHGGTAAGGVTFFIFQIQKTILDHLFGEFVGDC